MYFTFRFFEDFLKYFCATLLFLKFLILQVIKLKECLIIYNNIFDLVKTHHLFLIA